MGQVFWAGNAAALINRPRKIRSGANPDTFHVLVVKPTAQSHDSTFIIRVLLSIPIFQYKRSHSSLGSDGVVLRKRQAEFLRQKVLLPVSQ